MNRGRRYGRWLKRALIGYAIYLFFAWIFLDVGPTEATTHPNAVMGQLRQFLLTALVLMFFIVIYYFLCYFFFESLETPYGGLFLLKLTPSFKCLS